MAAIYTVGQALPNGATVSTDVFATNADGSTIETMVDSLGNQQVITTNGPNTPSANRLTIQGKVQANLATLETFITNNPNGAVLTAPQVNVLARMLAGLCRILLSEYSTVGGS